MHITWDKSWDLPCGRLFPDRLFCVTETIKPKRTSVDEIHVAILHFSKRGLITQGLADTVQGAFPELGLKLIATEKKLDVSMVGAVLDRQHGVRLLDAIVAEITSVITAQTKLREAQDAKKPIGGAQPKPRYNNRSRR